MGVICMGYLEEVNDLIRKCNDLLITKHDEISTKFDEIKKQEEILGGLESQRRRLLYHEEADQFSEGTKNGAEEPI